MESIWEPEIAKSPVACLEMGCLKGLCQDAQNTRGCLRWELSLNQKLRKE